jgi:tetratricopeptide (TPR) repeat protein
MDEVYETFLKSSDLATWGRCLDEYKARLRQQIAQGAFRAEDLARGVRIAIYVSWLSRTSRRVETEGHSRELIEQFTEAICRLHARTPTASTRQGLATLVAWRGYHKTAEAMLMELGELSPDVALLVTPTDQAKAAAFLRTPALHSVPFPPVFYFYCCSLMELGSVEEVRRLIDGRKKGLDDPMIGDLLGRNYEQSANWREAYEIYSELYRRFKWPLHAQRAAICNIIAEASQGDAGRDEFVIDEVVSQSLTRFESEINQSELARSSSFVNACRWNSFDNWLVHFELGKLNFRRRHYSAADAHFRLAVEKCPASARFSVASARFFSLSWVRKTTGARDLSMEPEALESASAALLAAGDEDKEASAGIRTWLAAVTHEKELLAPVFEASDVYSRGEAHDLMGNKPEAISCWLLCLEQSYTPRVVYRLIEVFISSGFAHTVDFLIDLVLKESWDDFFVLWELGMQLLLNRSAQELSAGHLDQCLSAVASRIEELSRFEFQHLIRAYEFFRMAGREDRAAAMLRQARTLADGPEENLSLAVARRNLSGFTPSEGDPLGLMCLRRAEREAGDRLERLQIAREYGYYGQVQQARRILQDAGVFRREKNFEPVEYVAALQCGAWLTPEELQDLIQDSIDSHARDAKAGVFPRYEGKFLARLLVTIASIDNTRAGRVRRLLSPSESGVTEAETTNQESGEKEWDGVGWKSWETAMQAKLDSGDAKGERELLARMVESLDTRSLDLKLTLWTFVYREMDAALAKAVKVRPSIEESRTPFSKSGKIINDWRAQEVTDLWKNYFASDTGESEARAMEQIKAFFAEEKQLLIEWEQSRREKAAEPLRRALYFAESARPILLSMLSPAPEHQIWPVMKGIHDALADDVAVLLKRVSARIEDIKR